ATLGANCTVVCGHVIGRYAFVGAGAVVQKDVPDFALVVGVPVRQIGWMSRHGERLALPLRSPGAVALEARCPQTAELYRLSGDRLELIESE
ncbi:N-acetyltransferase, partial [Roseateles sp. GG27B]